LGIPEKDYETITTQAGENLKSLVIGAALGSVPAGPEADQKELRAHARLWFKTQAGGRELAGKILPLGAWKELRDQLLPFLNAVRKTMGLSELTDLN
jgi:putative ATP-dependent endonuclease of OLD family